MHHYSPAREHLKEETVVIAVKPVKKPRGDGRSQLQFGSEVHEVGLGNLTSPRPVHDLEPPRAGFPRAQHCRRFLGSLRLNAATAAATGSCVGANTLGSFVQLSQSVPRGEILML